MKSLRATLAHLEWFDIAGAIGLGLVAGGLAQWSIPLAMAVTGGILLLTAAVITVWRARRGGERS